MRTPIILAISLLAVLGLYPQAPVYAEDDPQILARALDGNDRLTVESQGAATRAPVSDPTVTSSVPDGTEYSYYTNCGADQGVNTWAKECDGQDVCQVGGAEVNRSLQITRTNDAVTGIDTYCPTQGQQTLNAAAEAAFADTHIVVPEPGVQPGTSTLVNWPTTVYSTFTTYDTPTNLAGTPVKFRIMPTTYHWNFGDGTTMDSTWGGEQLDIDSLYRSVDWDMDAMQELLKDRAPAYREYTSCAHRTVQLSVTVGGQYSVNGGPYTTIAGTLTADAPPLVLNVREARSELVAPGAPPPSPRTCRHTGD